MRRPRWSVSFLMMTALVLSACTGDDSGDGGNGGAEGADADGGSGEQVTLDYWGFEEDVLGEFIDTVIAEFEAANPNISVEFTAFPEEQFGVRLQTALAAGQPPDLTLIFGTDEIREDLVLPLDDMVAAKGIDLSTYSQGIVSEGDEFSCAFEGNLYCLGSFQGVTMLLYNKDMFDTAGIPHPEPWPAMTPEEFLDIACQLTDPDNEVWGAGVSDPLAFLPWEVIVSEDGRTADGYVNGAASVQAHQLLADAYDNECVPSLDIVDPWEQGRDFFSRGQLAMVITDFQDLPQVEEAGINYGSTAVPTPDGYETYFYTWTDSTGVLADSDHPDEAMEFLAFLATEGQRIRFGITGDIPLDVAIAEEIDWAAGIPGRLEGLEVLSHARAAVFVPNRWDSYAPIYDAWGLIVGGEQDAQSALDDIVPAIEENLDTNWRAWEEG